MERGGGKLIGLKPLLLLAFLLCGAVLFGQPADDGVVPEYDPSTDPTDYSGASDAAIDAAMTNHLSQALREKALNDYTNGQIDFELLDGTVDALDEDPKYPLELEALDGKKVEFIGFMTPYDSIDEFKRFMMVNFPTGCNFCAIPRLQEIVFVQVDLAQTPPAFIDGITHITGTLKLKKPDRKFEIEGWLPDEKHDVFKEFIYIISDATAVEYDPDTKQPVLAESRPAWFWPAIGGVVLVSLLFGVFIHRS